MDLILLLACLLRLATDSIVVCLSATNFFFSCQLLSNLKIIYLTKVVQAPTRGAYRAYINLALVEICHSKVRSDNNFVLAMRYTAEIEWYHC